MPMTKKSLKQLRSLAKELVLRIDSIEFRDENDWPDAGPATSALRRQSMELTRALANMRKR